MPCRFESSLATEAAIRIFLEEGAAPPLLNVLPERPASAALLLGPEGGWTDRERELAAAAGWLPASLGPQVLACGDRRGGGAGGRDGAAMRDSPAWRCRISRSAGLAIGERACGNRDCRERPYR